MKVGEERRGGRKAKTPTRPEPFVFRTELRVRSQSQMRPVGGGTCSVMQIRGAFNRLTVV